MPSVRSWVMCAVNRPPGRSPDTAQAHPDAAGCEGHVPRSGPRVPAAAWAVGAQEMRGGRQYRKRHDARFGEAARYCSRPCRYRVDVNLRHFVGSVRVRRAARTARAQPMSRRTRPPMFHAQSYGVTSTP